MAFQFNLILNHNSFSYFYTKDTSQAILTDSPPHSGHPLVGLGHPPWLWKLCWRSSAGSWRGTSPMAACMSCRSSPESQSSLWDLYFGQEVNFWCASVHKYIFYLNFTQISGCVSWKYKTDNHKKKRRSDMMISTIRGLHIQYVAFFRTFS